MKVGYIAPMSITAVNGGVRTQAMFTISHLEELGVEPVLLSPWSDTNLQQLDLVHVFGASIENTGIIDQLSVQGIPFALSPVFYSNRSAGTIRRAIRIEQLLSVFGSGIRSDFSIKAELCRKADLLLPNTSGEARLIEKGFSIPGQKISVVPNGVEERFTEGDPELFRDKYGWSDFVLFVGQAGAPRKNVIKLLEAAPRLSAPVVIIGAFGNDHYSKRCKELANASENVHLIEALAHDSELLASAYAACKVFVLPSQYETPGIAAMEAALTGAKVVITERGGTQEYFGDFADYIDPDSVDSLVHQIEQALEKFSSPELKNHILGHYTWRKVAEETYQNYKKILA